MYIVVCNNLQNDVYSTIIPLYNLNSKKSQGLPARDTVAKLQYVQILRKNWPHELLLLNYSDYTITKCKYENITGFFNGFSLSIHFRTFFCTNFKLDYGVLIRVVVP